MEMTQSCCHYTMYALEIVWHWRDGTIFYANMLAIWWDSTFETCVLLRSRYKWIQRRMILHAFSVKQVCGKNKSSFSGSQHPSNVMGKRASGINSSFVAFANGGAGADRIWVSVLSVVCFVVD